MQFTKYQYDVATAALIDGSTQLEPDGRPCTVCGDGGHQAWECHHNPLRAMHLVNKVVSTARDLHEQLHVLGGYYNSGPSPGIEAVVPPAEDPEKIELSSEQIVGATFPVPIARVRKWRGDAQPKPNRQVEMPADVLGSLKNMARAAALDLSASQLDAVGAGLRNLREKLDTLVAFQNDERQVEVVYDRAAYAEKAIFHPDDQGGHMMFQGLCWRPVRS